MQRLVRRERTRYALSDLLDATADSPPQPTHTLGGVPIGIDDQGRPILLDINEAALGGAGPHGVLVGATGSGKSELLRSFVAALAVRHPSSLLNLLLVDFKGGAAFGGLADLPHTAGIVTNLADDLSMIGRVQAALVGELARRQQLLRTAGHASIRDFRSAASSGDHGADNPELSYLMVVVDEFGELLSARPELLDTIVQIGRLGRSLGVHLLLATQRLDEGRLGGLESHLRFRIALQTFTAAESVAVLGSAAAHDLPPEPGLGYLKVDGELTRFRAALATAPVRTQDSEAHRPVVERFTLARPGRPMPEEATRRTPTGGRTDLDDLVDRLRCQAMSSARPVWTAPLPRHLELTDLPRPRSALSAAVGLVDEPARQRQLPFVVDLVGGGSIGVVGAARSGRTTFLRTLVRALAAEADPSAFQVYALDLGGGGLTSLAALPHVGAVCGRHEPESVVRLLRRMHALARERAAALRSAEVASFEELRHHPDIDRLLAPAHRAHVLLLVDDLLGLRTDHPDEETDLTELAAAGHTLGLHLAVSAGRWLDLRTSLLDALTARIELRLADPADSRAGRARAAAVPARPGRGLTAEGLDLQLASAGTGTPARTSPVGVRAPRIAPLPLRIPAPTDCTGSAFPLGIEEHGFAPECLDLLAPGAHLLVYGDSGSGRSTLLARLVEWLSNAPGAHARLHVVDPRRSLIRFAGLPAVASYAYERTGLARLVSGLGSELVRRHPPPGLSHQELAERAWWQGPEHVLVVDDYDLFVRPDGSALSELVDALGAAADLGWHVVLVRRVSGSSRNAYDPFGQWLRETAPIGLLLSGDPNEGRILAGAVTTQLPPGRARLLRPGRPDVMVQTYLPATEAA